MGILRRLPPNNRLQRTALARPYSGSAGAPQDLYMEGAADAMRHPIELAEGHGGMPVVPGVGRDDATGSAFQ